MKKHFLTKSAVMAAALMGAVSLAACGGSNDTAAGTYTLTTVGAEGMTMDVAQMAEAMGMDEDSMKVALELKDGGELVLSGGSQMFGSDTLEGTWEAGDGTVDLTIDGDTITCELKDGVITLEENDTSMVFEK